MILLILRISEILLVGVFLQCAQIYSTAHRILQEDTVSCLQLETQAQPQLNTQIHSLARLNQQTLISILTPVLCPPLVVISITLWCACKNYPVILNYLIMYLTNLWSRNLILKKCAKIFQNLSIFVNSKLPNYEIVQQCRLRCTIPVFEKQ